MQLSTPCFLSTTPACGIAEPLTLGVMKTPAGSKAGFLI
jgi:hypothetical protein